MDDRLAQRIAAVLSACDAVKAAWIFGSVARGEEGPRSDVDIAVLGCASMDLDGRARLVEALSRAAGAPCDVAIVETSSPVLGMEIVRDGVRIVARDEAAADAWEDFAVRRYLGTAHLRRILHEGLWS